LSQDSEPIGKKTTGSNAVAESADETTANWPVPVNMKDELEALMPTHAAQPLPVYKDDVYVPPTEVNKV
jgi:hypothetical protein